MYARKRLLRRAEYTQCVWRRKCLEVLRMGTLIVPSSELLIPSLNSQRTDSDFEGQASKPRYRLCQERSRRHSNGSLRWSSHLIPKTCTTFLHIETNISRDSSQSAR